MYSQISRLKQALGDKSDLLLSGVEDSDLTQIMTDCSDLIDGYLKTVVKLPLTESNAILDQLCIKLSKAEIYRRYASNDIPKDISAQEESAYKTLEKIQQKRIVIVVDPTQKQDANFSVKSTVFNTTLY